ncbi:neuronal acetylcholine receptor subunit alpha-7-like [Stegodyphus dumicola]|uniref:neuronal acetylcholine receptor subunit alpha-7-like n=1 Tax=Stegodyphus dumicola TaxID=202533 RepID=UPI0015B2F579|nr:neuronal acetylcholine receptor subunit alpha-7-like [Stegodyphus dumicola]
MAAFLSVLGFTLLLCGMSDCRRRRHSPDEHRHHHGHPEKALQEVLFEDYNKLTRPVTKASNAVVVWVGMSPLKLRNLDEKHQEIELDTWVNIKWKDPFLKWQPEDYDNLHSLVLPAEEVWKPDISVYTATPDTSVRPTIITNVVVNSTGEIIWVPPFTIKSSCPMDSYDHKHEVICNIRIGSWTYNGHLLDLHMSKVDMSNYVDTHPDWRLVTVKTNEAAKLYECCDEEYLHINFNVTLVRKTSSHSHHSHSRNSDHSHNSDHHNSDHDWHGHSHTKRHHG